MSVHSRRRRHLRRRLPRWPPTHNHPLQITNNVNKVVCAVPLSIRAGDFPPPASHQIGSAAAEALPQFGLTRQTFSGARRRCAFEGGASVPVRSRGRARCGGVGQSAALSRRPTAPVCTLLPSWTVIRRPERPPAAFRGHPARFSLTGTRPIRVLLALLGRRSRSRQLTRLHHPSPSPRHVLNPTLFP